MSQGTPLTKEFFLEHLEPFRKEFAFMREQFKNVDTRFHRVEKKLAEHDELLEMIAGEVSGTQNLLNELAPARKDHETRITRLERGLTKLILKT